MGEEFEQIGTRLRLLISESGVSHTQLAAAIGVDKPRLSNWLSGRAPFTMEYAPLIIDHLGGTHRQLEGLRALHDVHKWRHRFEKLADENALGRFGGAAQHLTRHLIRLAKELADAELPVDPTIDIEELQIKHLHAAHLVGTSVVTALVEPDKPIFNEENIAAHLRFPANYYVAALLNLSDADFPGGAEIGHVVQRLVDDVVEARTGRTFLEKIMRQHVHHVNARYSKLGAERDELARLKNSPDVHDRRMFLIGAALRNGAQESAWTQLFDELQKPEFGAAVVAFDTSHYGDNRVEKDGIRPHPTQIRRTALRYFAGLLLPDPNQQLFAAKRLLTLLDHATPNMVRDAKLGAETQRVAEATGEHRPAEANQSFNLIKRIDDEK